MDASTHRWGRRRLLQTGAVALGSAGAGWSAASAAAHVSGPAAAVTPPPATRPTVGGRTVAFHGPHQAGIATPAQSHLSLLGLDLHPRLEGEALSRLMTLLSDDAARLSRGLPALADTEPELAVHPARLTVTFGFGPRVTAEMVTAAAGRVRALPAFRTDRLEEGWGQTDLVVQVCADDPMTVAHARRMLLMDARAFARLRWQQDGFRNAVGTTSEGTTMRNVMGQVDGTSNPVEADPEFARLTWSDAPGFEGGTFLAVRRIRARLDAWDAVDRTGRELVMGRRLDNGAPLTGAGEHDVPDLEQTDELGFPVIDPASHVARARSANPDETFVRRSYNYAVPDPSRGSGEDTGLVFLAYAADLERQFVPVQARLAELDRLNAWVTTIGSAVYAVPPGAAEGEHVAQRMLG